MGLKSCMAGLALMLAAGAAQAAEECPAKSSGLDDILSLLNGAPGCERAMKLFEACAFGASADVQFGAAVEKKCEADFLARLKPPQSLGYRRELRTCDEKYRNRSGTMYLSATAFCRTEAARRYARQASKAAGRAAR